MKEESFWGKIFSIGKPSPEELERMQYYFSKGLKYGREDLSFIFEDGIKSRYFKYVRLGDPRDPKLLAEFERGYEQGWEEQLQLETNPIEGASEERKLYYFNKGVLEGSLDSSYQPKDKIRFVFKLYANQFENEITNITLFNEYKRGYQKGWNERTEPKDILETYFMENKRGSSSYRKYEDLKVYGWEEENPQIGVINKRKLYYYMKGYEIGSQDKDYNPRLKYEEIELAPERYARYHNEDFKLIVGRPVWEYLRGYEHGWQAFHGAKMQDQTIEQMREEFRIDF